MGYWIVTIKYFSRSKAKISGEKAWFLTLNHLSTPKKWRPLQPQNPTCWSQTPNREPLKYQHQGYVKSRILLLKACSQNSNLFLVRTSKQTGNVSIIILLLGTGASSGKVQEISNKSFLFSLRLKNKEKLIIPSQSAYPDYSTLILAVHAM